MLFIDTAVGVNTKEVKELIKLKDNVGTRTNEYKLTGSKYRVEIRKEFLTITVITLCWSHPIQVMGRR